MIYRISTLPPSVNSMYAVNRRAGTKNRYRTPEYDLWLYESARELVPVTPLKSRKYKLDIQIPDGMKHPNSDLDNFLKPISDLLVKNGATPDDKHCKHHCIRETSVTEITITVEGV